MWPWVSKFWISFSVALVLFVSVPKLWSMQPMTRQLVGKLRGSGGEVSMSVGQVPVGGWEVDGCGYELLSRTVKKLQMVFVALPSSTLMWACLK